MSIVHGLPLGHFFLQLGVILLVCRICSMVMRKVGQPAIIGEMIAGIVLALYMPLFQLTSVMGNR